MNSEDSREIAKVLSNLRLKKIHGCLNVCNNCGRTGEWGAIVVFSSPRGEFLVCGYCDYVKER